MTKPDITPEQAKNLDKLATYLEGLPEDYELFDMRFFGRKTEHGTIAGACGHGPAAGVERKDSEGWESYACRAYGVLLYRDDWRFLFSYRWHWYQRRWHHPARNLSLIHI